MRALALSLALASADAFCRHAGGRIGIPLAPAFSSPATKTACRPFVRKRSCSIESTSRKATVAAASVSKRSKRDLMWESRFNELKSYKDEFGDCNVSTKEGRLGRWVSTQRKSHKKGNMSGERMKQLESIGFTWDQLEEVWEAQFNDLMKYKDEVGDCNVSSREGRLGSWVAGQRKSYRKGELSQERVEQLESIGFAWDPLEYVWEERFNELKKYKDDHGNCNVGETEGPLGHWVQHRRDDYRRGNLAEDSIEQLESIGFSWDPREEGWKARFDELVQYRKENGDCNVPQKEGPLGMWVSSQRTYYKKGKLSQERCGRLERVGFEWELQVHRRSRPTDEQWRSRYIELVHYLTEHGTCSVPMKCRPLGTWVGRQRMRYKEGRLKQYRRDYLESIGFAWELRRKGRYLPDGPPKPNLKAVARLIKEEQGTPIAEALEAYLDGVSTN